MTETAEHSARRGLTRWQAIPLAIGSIAGSGILFLPSAVYSRRGPQQPAGVGVVDAAVPADAADVRRHGPQQPRRPRHRGVHPAGARRHVRPLRAGDVHRAGHRRPAVRRVRRRPYVAQAFDVGRAVDDRHPAAPCWPPRCWSTSSGCAPAPGCRPPPPGAWWWWPPCCWSPPSRRRGTAWRTWRRGQPPRVVLPGVLLAFWAFAGFENLTFLAGSSAIRSATSCRSAPSRWPSTASSPSCSPSRSPSPCPCPGRPGGRAAATRPRRRLRRRHLWAVTFIACCAMLLNAVAWVWGVSQLVRDAADNGMLPAAFGASQGGGRAARGPAGRPVLRHLGGPGHPSPRWSSTPPPPPARSSCCSTSSASSPTCGCAV